MKKKLLLLIILNLFQYFSFGQSLVIDSLLTLIKAAKADTQKVNILMDISIEYYFQSDFKTALEYVGQCQRLSEKNNYLKGFAASSLMSGTIYSEAGNYPKALENYYSGLKLYEKLGNEKGISDCLAGMGGVYLHQRDLSKALDNYSKSLSIKEKTGDKIGIAICLNSIGLIYEKKNDYSKALGYHFQALEINNKINNQIGISTSLNNIGFLYDNFLNNYDKGLSYYLQSLDLSKKIGDQYGVALELINIGKVYLKQKDYSNSLKYFNEAYPITEKIEALDLIRDVNQQISANYKELKQYDKSLKHYQLYISARDSMFNEENTKKLVQSEMNYEFEKKEQIGKIEQEKKDSLHKAEVEQQTMQRNGFIAGFALMMALAGVSYRSYRNKRKAHELIEKQKAEVEFQKSIVETKNKDITDSINYAKQIQQAILPFEERFINAFGNDFFIHFKPKDIVSGDFYWCTEKELLSPTGEGSGVRLTFLAVVDCTGHGVPGAFMSMVGSAALSNIVNEKNIYNAGEILTQLNKDIRKALNQEQGNNRDGMDMVLCVFDKLNKTVEFAGANNPLYIIQHNELTEIKGNKFPIGGLQQEEERIFTTHTITLDASATLYLSTDGYADQFGGEKGKKFKYSKLKELLISIQHEPMNKQHQILNETFETWKGNHEQVDDVCLVGVKI